MQVAKMFPVRKGSHPGKLLDHSPATSISLSKLADESQLGSLSKLLTPAHNNNVNDCNYEGWSGDVPMSPVTNSCGGQSYESTLHYKSFMPLKKRFRQDFPNEIIIESTNVSIKTVKNELTIADTSPVLLGEETDLVPVDECPLKVELNAHKVAEDIHEGRTTKFRACKGERYKMFMNSNRRTRNKTNRWDLRQKSTVSEKLLIDGDFEIQQRISDLSTLDMEDYNKSQIRNKRPKKIKTKRKKRQFSPTKSMENTECNLKNDMEEEEFLGMTSDGSKLLMKEEEEEEEDLEQENEDIKEDVELSLQINRNNNKENGIFIGEHKQINFLHEIKLENDLKTVNADITGENVENKTAMVVGSRKRKLRKQNIMRLQPGSTFKDTRVVEDSIVCDLGTLADVAVSTEQKTTEPSSVTS